MAKCCYYERPTGDRYTLCTSGNSCPSITGDTKIGEWGVDDCDDCKINTDEDTTADDDDTVTIRRLFPDPVLAIQETLRLMEMMPQVIERLKQLGFDPTKPPKPAK